MAEIYKNDGGFRLISAGVPKPTVRRTDPLTFDINLNLPAKDRVNHYAVDVYYEDRFVMRTNEYPIIILNEEIINAYNHHKRIKFTFITNRIVGNKQKSEPTIIYIQKTICSDEMLCSETAICSEEPNSQGGNN